MVAGDAGAYVSQHRNADVRVPASLQATIAARIDRIGPTAKRTLNAAAVIGLRFDSELLAGLVEDVELSELIGAELIDQVRFTHLGEFAFRHPLIRAVAYESQLISDRSASAPESGEAIEEHDPELCDANAALIAEHLEAAGDLREAFGWHMRAGEWARFRDVNAAYRSWQRAREVADRLPVEDLDRPAMRIAPRVLICGNNWRVGLGVEETGFDELQGICRSVGDNLSLAVGMAGMLTALLFHNKYREAALIASDCSRLSKRSLTRRSPLKRFSPRATQSSKPVRWPKVCAWPSAPSTAMVTPQAQHDNRIAVGFRASDSALEPTLPWIAGFPDDFADAIAWLGPQQDTLPTSMHLVKVRFRCSQRGSISRRDGHSADR